MVSELIRDIVIVAFVGGLVSFAYAWFVILEEHECLKRVESMMPQTMSATALQSLASPTDIKDFLIGRRMADMFSAWKASQQKLSGLPSLNDLHRLSARQLSTGWAASLLRLLSSVLLIIGICGTLWGVHSALSGSESHILRNLPNALEPSKWAVLSTVFLLSLRAYYERCAEKLLCRMDKLTMTRLMPCLQQGDTFERTLNDFSHDIKAFSSTMQGYAAASDAMRQFSQSFSETAKGVRKLEKNMNDTLNAMAADERRMSQAQQDLEKKMKEATQVMDKLKTAVDGLAQMQGDVLHASSALDKPLTEWEKSAPMIRAATQAISAVAAQAEGAQRAAAELQSMADEAVPFRAELVKATEALVAETEQSKRATKRLDGHVFSFRPLVKAAESAEMRMEATIGNANDAVRKAQVAVDLSQKGVEQLKQSVSSMEGSAAVLQGKIEALEQMLQAPAEA